MQSFSDSYLNGFSILKNAVIGFELEFYSKINYPSTLEVFNRKLPGIKVWGFKQYHSTFQTDNKNFKLEPDLSGGFNMAELVTGPMPYIEARLVLVQLLKIIQEIGYTTERSGIHVNLSFNKEAAFKIEAVNPLKLILAMDEQKVYDAFPDRVNNVYAKSIKNIIPFAGYDYSTASATVLNNSLLLPYTKYYGINFSTLESGRLEFRYLGGEHYERKVEDLLNLIDYFVMITWTCMGREMSGEQTRELKRYLDKNIGRYKTMNKLESFLAYYPSVAVQVDKVGSYDVVNAYFNRVYDRIFTLVNGLKTLEDCILNFDTETKKLEIVNADIHATALLKNIDFIDCFVSSGDFQNCELIGCDIEKAIINHCKVVNSTLTDSKLLESTVDELSELKDCYFSDGFMDGQMRGGVFRSGKVGKNAIISKETKLLNKEQNFFNIDVNTINGNSKKDSKKKGA